MTSTPRAPHKNWHETARDNLRVGDRVADAVAGGRDKVPAEYQ